MFEGIEEMSLANVRFELTLQVMSRVSTDEQSERRKFRDQGGTWIESPGVTVCMDGPGWKGLGQRDCGPRCVSLCVRTHLHMPTCREEGGQML